MKSFAQLLALFGAFCAFVLPTPPAHAQATRTWVSGVGDDINPCSRDLPCKTFAGAFSQTSAGGEINCRDAGAYGMVTINKSITIACEGTTAGILASGINGVVVNVGASDIVVLRGLDINGVGTGLNGINFIAGGTLIVEQCVIRNFNAVAPNGNGIRFAPTGAGRLIVAGSYFSNNGGGSTGAGILINPAAGGSAQANIERVSLERNVFGFVADGTGSTAGMNVTITDSVVTGGSQDGVIAVTPGGGAPIGLMVKNTKSTNNAIGIRSIGPNVNVRVDGSAIIGNGTGLSFSGGGALLSFGNNNVAANGANGAFSGPVALQ